MFSVVSCEFVYMCQADISYDHGNGFDRFYSLLFIFNYRFTIMIEYVSPFKMFVTFNIT